MSALIDSLRTAKSFQSAGFPQAQAESLATTIAEATSSAREDLVTKDFFKAEMAGLKNDLIRWVMGSQVALIVILIALSNFTKVFG
jgi:hypothetical protein